MTVRWGVLGIAATLAVAATGYGVWRSKQPAPLSTGFASGNGRIEAVDIDIAAKTAGRVREILVDEGDWVQAGQTVARMDTDALASELRQAQAQVKRSENARATAIAVVRQRESMPVIVQNIMLFAPTTHFVSFAQAILYRAAGLDVVWPKLLATGAIGTFYFAAALARFRKAITTQQG